MGVAGAAGWFLSLLSGAVVLTWLYNESEGSILVVAIFHAAIDTVFTSGLSSGLVANGIGVLITSWAIVVLVVAGPGNLSRRGKRSGCTVPAP
jgi:membrane protease YdiL (CAAX protease family)